MASAESPLAAEAALVRERATREWLRGDTLRALASAVELDREVYRVRGLDEDGHPTGRVEKALDNMFFTDATGKYVSVRGDHPQCAAVGLYQALSDEHTWFAITSHRIAVLRLRDLAKGTAVEGATTDVKAQKSIGGALKGLGKLVKESAVEFAKSTRRPPLAERPADAVLESAFEAPVDVLARVDRWKQPMVPEFNGGPRWLQVHFADGSWARVQTDQAGLAAMTGAPD